jgi:hypothetical protein
MEFPRLAIDNDRPLHPGWGRRILGPALAIALIFGIFVTLSAAIAAFHLTVVAVAVYRLTGKYLWNIGGYEFCLFWAICCWVVASLLSRGRPLALIEATYATKKESDRWPASCSLRSPCAG